MQIWMDSVEYCWFCEHSKSENSVKICIFSVTFLSTILNDLKIYCYVTDFMCICTVMHAEMDDHAPQLKVWN